MGDIEDVANIVAVDPVSDEAGEESFDIATQVQWRVLDEDGNVKDEGETDVEKTAIGAKI